MGTQPVGNRSLVLAPVQYQNGPSTIPFDVSGKDIGYPGQARNVNFSVNFQVQFPSITSDVLNIDLAQLVILKSLIVGLGTVLQTMSNGDIPNFQIQGTTPNSSAIFISDYSNDTTAPSIETIKSRGSSIGALVGLNVNDLLFRFLMGGVDSTNALSNSARYTVAVSSAPSAGRIPSQHQWNATGTSGTANSMLMTLDYDSGLSLINGKSNFTAAGVVAGKSFGFNAGPFNNGTATAFDFNNGGSQYASYGANQTITLSNGVTGQRYVIYVTNTAGVPITVTVPEGAGTQAIVLNAGTTASIDYHFGGTKFSLLSTQNQGTGWVP